MQRKDPVKVLLIESDPGDARYVQDLLKAAGDVPAYSYMQTGRIDEALRYVRGHEGEVDVIVSGVALPDARGIKAIDALGPVGTRLPVIFISSSRQDLSAKAIQGGAQDYLVKGRFDGGLLARSIAYAIERKKAELSLQDTRERLQVVIDNAASCLFLLDGKGKVQLMNPAAEQITGYRLDEIKDKLLHDVLHHSRPDGSPYPREDCPLVTAYVNLESTRGEDIYIRKDGSYFPIAFSMSTIKRDGRPVGAVFECQDITDRKKLERQKDDFIGIASHELKTPVTSIKAYAQVLGLRFKRAGDASSQGLVGKMDAQLNKLTYLISDLLDVTKIESGKLLLQKTYFDYNELVEEIVEEVQHTTVRHTILTDLAISKKIYGDRYRIGQVLTNLITNAIKYSPRTDKITVRTTTHGKTVTTSVQDQGVGIPPEKIGRVFERFYRVGGPTQETYSGLGLGLYIASEIINRHHGTIQVESELGRGTTFHFTLPVKYKPKALRRTTVKETASKDE